MDEKTKLLSKQANELTVGESIKLSLGMAAVTAAVPIATMMVIGSISSGVKKLKLRRENAQTETTAEEE